METSVRPDAAARALGRWHRFGAELIALIYIAVIAEIAYATGAFYVLFPELGALSHDAFTRPRGTWASAPLLLAITPVLTGAIGIVVTRALPYGFLSVMLAVGGIRPEFCLELRSWPCFQSSGKKSASRKTGWSHSALRS
jgi:hypothetical protein